MRPGRTIATLLGVAVLALAWGSSAVAAPLATSAQTPGGAAVLSSPALAVAGGTSAPPPLVCTGNGTSGNRVQLTYAHEGTNNYSLREPAIRQAIWEAQTNINDSAKRDGAQRLLNVVHNASCQATINTIQVPPGQTNAGNWNDYLKYTMGFSASNRIYLTIGEEFGDCGGTGNDFINNDSTPGTGNLHNSRTIWITVKPGCLDGHTFTHELAHALGGLLPGAPHVDSGNHCTDGFETLCQPTSGPYACPDPIWIRYLDCGRDDYFAVNPTGSYLPTHFNAALHSLYLTTGSSVTPVTTPTPLPPQSLQAVDIQGTSIAFAFRAPGDNRGITAYEILRNGSVVATIPGSENRTTTQVTGLPNNTTSTYTVRSRVTVGSTNRYSVASQPLSATTITGSAPAGVPVSGAVMLLSNDIMDPNGAYLSMDVAYSSPNENAEILQYPRNQGFNQQWELTSTTGGTYTLRSKLSSKCLSVLGSSTAAGATIVQTTCTSAANQRWTFAPITGLTYQLRNANSNLCIQSENLSTGALTRLVQGSCSSSQPTQRWTAHRLS